MSQHNEMADQTGSALALGRITRFAIVGCANTAVDFSIFFGLISLVECNAVLANSVSYSLGVVCSYNLNRIWTFSDRATPDKTREFALFVILNGFALFASNL